MMKKIDHGDTFYLILRDLHVVVWLWFCHHVCIPEFLRNKVDSNVIWQSISLCVCVCCFLFLFFFPVSSKSAWSQSCLSWSASRDSTGCVRERCSGRLAADADRVRSKHTHSHTHTQMTAHCCLSGQPLWLAIFPSDKLWYCRLSPNHKMLHYGDVEEDTDNPPIETLQEKSELKLGCGWINVKIYNLSVFKLINKIKIMITFVIGALIKVLELR